MKPSLHWHWLLLFALLAVGPAAAIGQQLAPGEALAQAVEQRALRQGDRGERVVELQRLLQAAGFDAGPLDGRFGPLTRQAVQSAQRRYGLTVDGLAGRQTIAALRGMPALAPASDSAGDELVFYRAGSAPRAATEKVEAVPAMGTQVQAALSVGLTINGLPPADHLERLLTQLADRGMAVTFFVTGEEAEAHPDLLAQIQAAGHEVGSMGYVALDMRQVTPITAQALVRRAQKAIAAAIGEAPRHFRPPLGRFDEPLLDLVAAEGLTTVLWSNVGIRALPEVEPERLAAQWAEALYPEAVLMLPADRENALAALELLLPRMEALGYRSRTLSTLQP